MAAPTSLLTIDDAASRHGLSQRGAYNMIHRDIWSLREKQFSDPWTPTNPDGTINLRLAENNILHDDIQDFIHAQLRVEGVQHLTYSTGPRGSLRLRRAAAKFLENEFASLVPVTEDDLFITPGLTSAVDAVVWAICNEGDGIIIPRPFYNGFKVDVQHRTGAVVVEADFEGLEGFTTLDDIFDPALNRKCLERAFENAQAAGITVRGVLIANPHNPLGRCYPIETLKEIASFCSSRGCHFISDEIYARSVFNNPNIPEAPAFISTLAFDLTSYIDPRMHHVLYGASKDFCANGLRLGFLYTKNKGLIGATSSNSPFSWSPHILQDVWAGMLEDDDWRSKFFAKNKRAMEEQYQLATSLFKDAGIKYYEMNAGVYIWIDLRPWFVCEKDRAEENYASLKMSLPGSEKHAAHELQIIEACAKNGIHIAPGSSYREEEYGWFRVTFTTTTAPLEEGIKRIVRSLEEIRANETAESTSEAPVVDVSAPPSVTATSESAASEFAASEAATSEASVSETTVSADKTARDATVPTAKTATPARETTESQTATSTTKTIVLTNDTNASATERVVVVPSNATVVVVPSTGTVVVVPQSNTVVTVPASET